MCSSDLGKLSGLCRIWSEELRRREALPTLPAVGTKTLTRHKELREWVRGIAIVRARRINVQNSHHTCTMLISLEPQHGVHRHGRGMPVLAHPYSITDEHVEGEVPDRCGLA